jgi:hypothetical protein
MWGRCPTGLRKMQRSGRRDQVRLFGASDVADAVDRGVFEMDRDFWQCDTSLMNETPALTVIQGGRAALEVQALLTIPHDFQKFLRLTRALQRPANSLLAVVPGTMPETRVCEPRPEAPGE